MIRRCCAFCAGMFEFGEMYYEEANKLIKGHRTFGMPRCLDRRSLNCDPRRLLYHCEDVALVTEHDRRQAAAARLYAEKPTAMAQQFMVYDEVRVVRACAYLLQTVACFIRSRQDGQAVLAVGVANAPQPGVAE